MNKSMTGYGTARFENDQLAVTVEVKTLNSKFLDANIRLPKVFSDKEIEVRNILSDQLERGKVALSIEYQKPDAASTTLTINKKLFLNYYQELQGLASDVGADSSELFKLALQSPEVMVNEKSKDDFEEDWKIVMKTLNKALEQCTHFRIQEGEALAKSLASYADRIEELLGEIAQQEPVRHEAMKERLKQGLQELTNPEEVDKNRFEQELIYYIEKLDINEEKVRLSNHLSYFREILNSEKSQGKKLGFVSQEIGREINTIGSKANDAVIQKLVVNMKEELEKIKEQVLNVI